MDLMIRPCLGLRPSLMMEVALGS